MCSQKSNFIDKLYPIFKEQINLYLLFQEERHTNLFYNLDIKTR